MIRDPFLDVKYIRCHWQAFDYAMLGEVRSIKRPGNQKNSKPVNDCWIMADTETSKSAINETDKTGMVIPVYNYVVAWTISIRSQGHNLCTLYGHRPSTMIQCIDQIQSHLHAHRTFLFFHNASYDWVFLRKFMINAWGEPVKQLNTKPHYPIIIEFKNGIFIRDSLIIAQRRLEKWAEDMDADHKKAVGKWDYDKIRNQGDEFTDGELEYIEHDTLAGVECLDIMAKLLNKNIATFPYTATGIPREEMRKRGKKNQAHEEFVKLAPDADEQKILENHVYHGGYTHANRFFIGDVRNDITAYDFSSSYPYCLLSEKYPMHRFTYHGTCTVDDILKYSDKYAFYFRIALVNVELKDPAFPMPTIQVSKCLNTINAIVDNGRIVAADFVILWMNEIDLSIIAENYKWEKALCQETRFTTKEYLPRWFTDFVYECYEKKCSGKGGDPVEYSLLKMRTNSLYGMCCQKPCKPDIKENYITGEYTTLEMDFEEKYNKYIENKGSVLPFTVGCWCTSYAMKNLFSLGSCAGLWLYSDTDSCYGQEWDNEKVGKYNNECIRKLERAGYKGVGYNGRTYYPGIAELDGKYTEFVALGSKRYCGRSASDNKLHITVAGVPKIGVEQLNDDIKNFKMGMIFKGSQTGKLAHSYICRDSIEIINGNEVGDSIDLNPCDYLLDQTDRFTIEDILKEEIELVVADE